MVRKGGPHEGECERGQCRDVIGCLKKRWWVEVGCLHCRPKRKSLVFLPQQSGSHRPYYVIRMYCNHGTGQHDKSNLWHLYQKGLTANKSVARPKMAPWEDFDSVFSFNKNFTYDGKVIEEILSNRRALDNQLFADRLLGLLGVKAGKNDQTLIMYNVSDKHNYIVTKVYPPKSNADLRTLFGHIVSSPLDIHHKQALIYYLLKDCRAANDYASQFSRRFHLPEKYRFFIEGLWNLDRLDFKVRRGYRTCDPR